jgi:DNA-binding transcriptional ArsR family regulator
MTRDDESTQLSPDEAFAVLGNETRVEILRVLGAADEALAFSELYDELTLRVDDSLDELDTRR